MDYYATLGVSKTATSDEIKKAYKKLASKYHPDKEGGSTEKFQKLQEAYDTLSDPVKRAKYDNPSRGPNINFNHNGFNGFSDFDEFDHFDKFDHSPPFNDDVLNELNRAFGFQFGSRPGIRKNKDLRINIEIPLESTLSDQTKTISLRTTKGTQELVEVHIPKGTQHNNTIKYRGLGDNFFDKLPRGDLYVLVHVAPHPKFEVQESNLITKLTISVYDAILGTQVEVCGLDGKTFMLTIPPGTQPNTKFRIKDQGLYSKSQQQRGHLYVEVHVEVPTNLTEAQRELVLQLKKDNYDSA